MSRYSEGEKISNELLNEIYPMETLNKYYLFGWAEAMRVMMRCVETHIENTKDESIDVNALMNTIGELVNHDEVLKGYYDRLRKEDDPTNIEYKLARLRRLRDKAKCKIK